MNENLPTGTVTFLFTDIEGSTNLAQEYAQIWESLRQQHDRVLRSAIEAQNGYVFRIVGDAFCAAFHTMQDALRAALQAQLALHAKNWEGPPIEVRMGIHTGQAVLQEDSDYQGYLTLTRVQRVMSAAYGGQILLSNAAAELVRSELPEDVFLLDMKEHRLKGLLQPDHLWQVAKAELPQNFPPLHTLSNIPHNLPLQLTSFIGREQEVATIQQVLDNHRILTLTGPGGIGKTRLSLEVAAELVNTFPHGVWFVELAHVMDPSSVATTIAHVFNLKETAGRDSMTMIKDYLRDKELLLILDNFEQVIEAAVLVKELIVIAPGLKILVTSRTPLRITGEYEFRVPLLPLPDREKQSTLEELAKLGSVRLFVERAKSSKADFALTADNAPAVAETCQRLDGLPLAIELAAARVRVLPPQKMLSQLEDRLKFLTSASRDLPSRQQTLRAAIAWSYDLLTTPEKLLFQRMAVFTGGATLEALNSVCDVSQHLDLLTGLESLLDKNLIRQIEVESEVRYGMLETIRDFADEVLVASVEDSQIRARHLKYFHELASEAEPNLVSPSEMQWMLRLTEEHENLRAAILWGLEHDLEKSVELLCALALFWSRGGHNDEVIQWLNMALSKMALREADPAPPAYLVLRARALLTLGILSLQQGLPEAAPTLRESIVLLRQADNRPDLAEALAFAGYLGDLEAAQESIDVARTTDNKWTLAYCLVWQSQALRLAGGDFELAERSAEEGAALSREVGSDWAVARSLLSQGQLAVALGDLGKAHPYFRECLELFSRSQDKYHENMARTELAHVERWQRNDVEAIRLYQQAAVVWQDLGLKAAVARQFECITMIQALQGNYDHAARLSGAAQKLRQQAGSQMSQKEQAEYNERLEAVRSQLDLSLFTNWVAEGQAMTMKKALAYILELSQNSS